MALISLNVNYKDYLVDINPNESLLEVLRLRLDFGSDLQYCKTGICGSCSVLIDGIPTQVCTIKAVDAQRKKINTSTGLFCSASSPKLEVACIGRCDSL